MREDFVPPGFGMVAGRVTDPLLTLQNTRGEGSFPAPTLLPFPFDGLSWLC